MLELKELNGRCRVYWHQPPELQGRIVMIPLRLLGLGACAFLIGGCTQPAPVVNVTVVVQPAHHRPSSAPRRAGVDADGDQSSPA